MTRTIQDLEAEVHERLARPYVCYQCELCGAEQDAGSQRFYSGGKAVCLECFEKALGEARAARKGP